MALWTLPSGPTSWTVPTTAAQITSVTVAASGTTHTKGAWTELLATTPAEVQGFYLYAHGYGALSSTDSSLLVDVGIGGAGVEVVAVANIQFGSTAYFAHRFYFPLRLPSGARISARAQSAIASKTVVLTLVPVYGYPMSGSPVFGACTTYGADTATSRGPTIISGTGAKGSWVQLVASTSDVIDAVAFSFGATNYAVGVLVTFDLGVGGSGSEVVVVSDVGVQTGGSEEVTAILPTTNPFRVNIPAGSRLAIRIGGAAYNELTAIAHAFR